VIDPHGRRDVGQHGRLEKGARPVDPAAGQQHPRAIVEGVLVLRLQQLGRGGARQRTDRRLRSKPSPMFCAANWATNRSTNSSAIDSCTMMRLGELHICPPISGLQIAAVATAAWMFADSRTM
jgi:hypothetical protein